jgi:hypothetical protein
MADLYHVPSLRTICDSSPVSGGFVNTVLWNPGMAPLFLYTSIALEDLMSHVCGNGGRSAGRLITLAIVAWLQGCASMNAEQCKVADWRLVGYRDGVLGKSAATVGTYSKDCAEHAVVPDLDAWRAGRDEGLQEYCRPENGFRLGESGKGWNAVCPDGVLPAFQAAWQDGRAIYQARAQVNQTHSLIYKHRHSITELEQDKREKLAALVQDGLHADQRVVLLYEIHEIDEQISVLSRQVSELEQDLGYQQARLDNLTR